MRNRKRSHAGMGEQNNKVESTPSVPGMEADRAERTSSAGAHGDARAGDEGVDDAAMSRVRRDDMSATPMHGDRLAGDMSEDMNEDISAGNRMSASQRDQSQRSTRTEERANDEEFDNAQDFTGEGGQKEGSHRSGQEGTGYTRERSNTDDSSPGNPLS